MFCLLVTAVFAEDVMVERMQSVVDEVVDLRARYEDSEKKLNECVNELQAQEKTVTKLSRGEGLDYKEYEKSREEIQTLKAENKKLKNYEKEIQTLEKQNQRLTSSARILVDKNQELLKQVNRYKKVTNGEVQALEIELKTTLELLVVKKAQNSKLQEELRIEKDKKARLKPCAKCSELKPCLKCKPCKKSKVVTVTKVVERCKDQNPFPKLMSKDGKTVNSHPVELDHIIKVTKVPTSKKVVVVKTPTPKRVVTEKASSYRMKNEAAVYAVIDGKVVAIWEAKTSFTSNIMQGEWIKITGYFVNKKWKRVTNSLWVKRKDTIKR